MDSKKKPSISNNKRSFSPPPPPPRRFGMRLSGSCRVMMVAVVAALVVVVPALLLQEVHASNPNRENTTLRGSGSRRRVLANNNNNNNHEDVPTTTTFQTKTVTHVVEENENENNNAEETASSGSEDEERRPSPSEGQNHPTTNESGDEKELGEEEHQGDRIPRKENYTFDPTNIRVACLGDSITQQGCPAVTPSQTYAGRLRELLGGSNFTVTNYGHNGQTLLRKGVCTKGSVADGDYLEWGCSYWDTDELEDALESNPDVVTILLGTNDAKPANWYGPQNGPTKGSGDFFLFDYLFWINKLWDLPSKPYVILMIPPPLVPPPAQPDYGIQYGLEPTIVNKKHNGLRCRIEEAYENRNAAEGDDHVQGVGLVDLWEAFGGTEGYFNRSLTCDGVHPTKQAHAIIAESLHESIRIGREHQIAMWESLPEPEESYDDDDATATPYPDTVSYTSTLDPAATPLPSTDDPPT